MGIQRKKANWILDADVVGFFDNLSHEWAIKFIEHRVADRRILRLIRKWLKAGVSEVGQWSESNKGTPQGAVVSPLIANVYLHYLFDLWADVWRRKVAKGDVVIVRYADDVVLGFQQRADAVRFLEEFKERLAKFGLELHPDKTRLIEFGAMRPVSGSGVGKGNRRPSTSWASPTSVGNATRPRPSPSGESLRRSEWWRSSRSSRLSFNAVSMIAPVRSVYGFGVLSPATTNTMLSPATSINCASSKDASIDCGVAYWYVVVNARGRSGRSSLRSSTDGYHHLAFCILIPTPAFTPPILHKSRMRKRARTDLSGLRLETHEVQSPEMEAAAKLSSQPRTKSCVMSGDGHCEA